MSRYIRAIILIFICTTIAWSVLGTTIFSRTYSFDSTLRNQVASIWGAPHVQRPPSAHTTKTVLKKEETKEGDKTVLRTVQHYVTRNLPLEGSQVDVNLDLEHRQKGLLWYSTYKVGFNGAYRFENTTDEEEVTIHVAVSDGAGDLRRSGVRGRRYADQIGKPKVIGPRHSANRAGSTPPFSRLSIVLRAWRAGAIILAMT